MCREIPNPALFASSAAPSGSDDALIPAPTKLRAVQKSWKSLDSVSIEETFCIHNDSSVEAVTSAEEAWSPVAEPLLNYLNTKPKTTTALPAPSKFPSSRRNRVSRESTQSSFSNLEWEFNSIFEVESEPQHFPNAAFCVNDLVRDTEITRCPQNEVLRNFRLRVKFVAGLENEAERRRQGSWLEEKL